MKNSDMDLDIDLKFNESILDRKDLECNVCLEVPSSNPIYQCKNGHLFCKKCHQKIIECPVCQQGKLQLGNVTCLIAQKNPGKFQRNS